MDVFLGLKPQAESYCPFGAENQMLHVPSKLALTGLKPWAILVRHFMAGSGIILSKKS
jgi:hypothetical protein